jgi:glutathione S-transferase
MSRPVTPIRVYRYELSGHSHRVELFLSLLDLAFERIDVDLFKGAHRTKQFAAKNPLLQVPVIEDGDVTLADSNAILVYLAMRYDHTGRWLPRDPVNAAQVQRWLSIAAGELASGLSTARLVVAFGLKLDYERSKAIATRILTMLNSHLHGRQFLVGEGPTIADVAIYSYTACAPEGGVSLESFENVRRWLERIERLPRFISMKKVPAGNEPL